MNNCLLKEKQLMSAIVDNQKGYGAVSSIIQPLEKNMICNGPAVTVWTTPGNNGFEGGLLQLVSKGDVVVIDACGENDLSVLSKSFCEKLLEKGVSGVVVNGAVGFSDSTLPVFASGIQLKKALATDAFFLEKPVSIGGVPVHSGDFVLGSNDGIVVIPKENM